MAALLMLTSSEGLLLLSVCTVKTLQANRDANDAVILSPNNRQIDGPLLVKAPSASRIITCLFPSLVSLPLSCALCQLPCTPEVMPIRKHVQACKRARVGAAAGTKTADTGGRSGLLAQT